MLGGILSSGIILCFRLVLVMGDTVVQWVPGRQTYSQAVTVQLTEHGCINRSGSGQVVHTRIHSCEKLLDNFTLRDDVV